MRKKTHSPEQIVKMLQEADATNGLRSGLSAWKAVFEPAGQAAQDLSVPAEGRAGKPTRPGLVGRYNLCSYVSRLALSCGSDGLV